MAEVGKKMLFLCCNFLFIIIVLFFFCFFLLQYININAKKKNNKDCVFTKLLFKNY